MKRRDFNYFLAALVGLGVKPATIKEAATSVHLDVDELNLLFLAHEKAMNDMIVRKVARNTNAYWGRIRDDGNFPTGQGAVVRKRKKTSAHS